MQQKRTTIRVNLLRAHGSPTQYQYAQRGCRCAPCRKFMAEYQAANYAAHREERAASQAAYRFIHRDKTAVVKAAYRSAHREERAAYRLAHREERCASSAAWGFAHREERAASGAAYKRAHRDEGRATGRNRRARKRNAPGTHTATDVRAQYARQKGRCFWGRRANPDCAVSLKAGYHVDHVTPLVKKGSNGTENIVLTCPSCNLRKGTKSPMDWGGCLL